MTERGTKTMIGTFVLGAVAILIGLVALIGSGSLSSQKNTRYVMYFDGSLRGLNQGSPVYFKGVLIGRVTSIQISAENGFAEFKAPVIIELDSAMIASQIENRQTLKLTGSEHVISEMIVAGLRGKLGMQSLITGQLTIDLDMYPDDRPIDPINLTRHNGLQQIPTLPSPIDALINSVSGIPLQEITHQLRDLLRELNDQISSMNFARLSESITSTSDSLRSEVIAFSEVRDNLNKTLQDLTGMAHSTETGLTQSLRQLDKALAGIEALSSASSRAMNTVAGTIAEDSAFMLEISQAMHSLREAADSVNQFATMLELKPDALLFGRERK